MERITYTLKSEYGYDPAHKGAPYIVNGRPANGGNFIEAAANECFTGVFGYDTYAVPFDKGSDIEAISASVKSSGASLACLYGDTMEEIVNEYFERVHSTTWVYGVQIDSIFQFYLMNADEFRMFLNEWAGLARESGPTVRYKVRIKKTSGKMVAWLDEKSQPH